MSKILVRLWQEFWFAQIYREGWIVTFLLLMWLTFFLSL